MLQGFLFLHKISSLSWPVHHMHSTSFYINTCQVHLRMLIWNFKKSYGQVYKTTCNLKPPWGVHSDVWQSHDNYHYQVNESVVMKEDVKILSNLYHGLYTCLHSLSSTISVFMSPVWGFREPGEWRAKHAGSREQIVKNCREQGAEELIWGAGSRGKSLGSRGKGLGSREQRKITRE